MWPCRIDQWLHGFHFFIAKVSLWYWGWKCDYGPCMPNRQGYWFCFLTLLLKLVIEKQKESNSQAVISVNCICDMCVGSLFLLNLRMCSTKGILTTRKCFSMGPSTMYPFTGFDFEKKTAQLRSKQGEERVHRNASRKLGSHGCQVEYRQIPVCIGHDDEGVPLVEFVDWPFVLPKSLVSCLCLCIFRKTKKIKRINDNELMNELLKLLQGTLHHEIRYKCS